MGKSTLVNALVGRKISIVTPRPQTTRHAIVGVLTRPGAQILFVDTPGLHARMRNQLNRAMNRAVEGALVGADVALFVVEAGAWKAADSYVLEHVLAARIPVILAVNKVDLVRPKSALLPVPGGLREAGRVSGDRADLGCQRGQPGPADRPARRTCSRRVRRCTRSMPPRTGAWSSGLPK